MPDTVNEQVAAALYKNRFGGKEDWGAFKDRKPDIAEIFRENATVAIRAYDKAVATS